MPTNPHTRAVALHPAGLVYVGTIEGLIEYDGVSWRLIRGTEGMIVHNVAVTASGRVFFSGAGVFGLLEPDPHGILVARLLQGDLPAAYREVGHVLHLVLTGEDAWFATQGLRPAIVRVDVRDRVTVMPIDGGCTSLFTHDGRPYFVTRAGVWRIEAGATRPVPASGAVRTAGIVSLWPGANGATWIVCADGLHNWIGDAARLVSEEVRNALAGDRVTAGCPVRNGVFLLGTDANGLLLVNTAGHILSRYGRDDRYVPTSGKISSLTPDRDGGVWITHYGGVIRAQFDGPTSLHVSPSDLHGRVEAFAFYQGHLYAATTTGVLARDEANGRFTLLPQGGMDAWALVPTEDGLIVAGDNLRLLKSDGRVEMIDERRLGFRAALRLRREPDRLVASTGPDGLLLLYRQETGSDGTRHWRFEAEVPGVRMPLYPLVEDEAGWLWGTRNRLELVRLDWRGGVRLDAKPERIGPERGLPEAEKPTFRVWIFAWNGSVEACNWQGIWRHDPATDLFRAEDRIAGLDPSRWSRAFPLADGSLWMANTRIEDAAALARRTGPDAWRFETLPRNGLESIRPTAVGDDPAADAWWIGYLGIAATKKDWHGAIPPPPTAFVRRVETAAGRVVWGGAGKVPGGTLGPNEKSVRFSFAAPFFQTDGNGRVNVTYRTRLDGIDSDWSAWGDGARRDYSSLPPGAFRFRVQARDDAGRAGSEAVFAFTRLAPWWRKPWAWCGYALLGAAGIGGIVHLRTLQLRGRAEVLEKVVAERTATLLLQNEELARLHKLELDQKTAARLAEEQARLETLRYQLNPHFLFNALASLNATLPANAGAARSMLTRLSEFCRTTLYRDDERERTTVGEELRQLGAYLEIEKTRWGDRLEIMIDCPTELEKMPLPHFLLLPLVENAIKYGHATSEDRIGVRIEVRRAGDAIDLLVSNTGLWIEPDGKPPELPSLGIGLKNLRERLARYQARACVRRQGT
ncbi:histidine kinase [Horticoccus luteus]|uniref:Histidine kinase n=1 Tax=Horticoccus luteus TaxID=2862869 RepID=A0A8F9TWZ6_9BACT|nr:histidine kinase [Horticoccus luteus]QYM79670.1 histidine kinase [Horticoccus luteus]